MEPYEKDVKLKMKQNRNPISLTNLAQCCVFECALNGNIVVSSSDEPHNDFYDGIKQREINTVRKSAVLFN